MNKKDFIDLLEKCIGVEKWTLENTPKDTNAWYIISGRIHAYNHMLTVITPNDNLPKEPPIYILLDVIGSSVNVILEDDGSGETMFFDHYPSQEEIDSICQNGIVVEL